MGQWRRLFEEVCDGVRQCPVPEKKNMRNCGQDDRTMGTVSGRDTRTIDTVMVDGDAVEIQDKEVRQREAEVLG